MSQTHPVTRILVTLLFAGIYAAFLVETGALFVEFRQSGLALRLATLDSQNFIFFPIAGLLALIAFWKPAVMLVDALARDRFRFGRLVLGASLLVCSLAAWGLASAFAASPARSMFEVLPAALTSDTGHSATDTRPALAPVPEVLARMKILSNIDGGLRAFRAQCDPEWLRYSTGADELKLCFPAGERISVRDCCRAKAAFRAHVNALAADHPSRLSRIHNLVLPVKCFFLLLLLGLGIFLVRYRKGLERVYGRLADISFGMALGGGMMLAWPLLNASYLETMSLLTGGTSSSAYTIIAPLVALGFGAWTLLLVFFHLRSYPSQIEYAAKIGGFIAAAVGVFRYEEITTYLSRTLGVGGSIVAIVVFGVAALALILSILLGVDPSDPDGAADETD